MRQIEFGWSAIMNKIKQEGVKLPLNA